MGKIIRTGAGKGRTTTSLTLHSLRNTFSSRFANARVDEDLRMKLVGHHTNAVHRGYSQHATQILHNAVLSVPGISQRKRKGWHRRVQYSEAAPVDRWAFGTGPSLWQPVPSRPSTTLADQQTFVD